MKRTQQLLLAAAAAMLTAGLHAQTFLHTSSTEGNLWQQTKVKLQSEARQTPAVETDGTEEGSTFKAWGATFNELDWDALQLLTRDEQDDILRRVFSPEGDLRIARGRVSMGANDYARSWYSCDEMAG